MAAVALPDDVFGERPELAVPMMEPCFPALTAVISSAVPCALPTTVSSASAVWHVLRKKEIFFFLLKRLVCLFGFL